jgi:cell shape-determining protein MreD
VLYKYAFKQTAKRYYIRNYLYIALFVLALIGLNFCMIDIENQWLQLLANGCISVAISFVICAVTILVNKDFRHYIKVFISRILAKLKKQTK